MVFFIFLSSFSFLFIISLQPHSPLTQKVPSEILMLFSWLKSIWLPQIFWKKSFQRYFSSQKVFLHSLPYFMPSSFKVPESTASPLLHWERNGVFSPSILLLTLLWLLSSSEKQVAQPGLRKDIVIKSVQSQPLAGKHPCTFRPDLGHPWGSREKGNQCGYPGSSLWVQSIAEAWTWLYRSKRGHRRGEKGGRGKRFPHWIFYWDSVSWLLGCPKFEPGFVDICSMLWKCPKIHINWLFFCVCPTLQFCNYFIKLSKTGSYI